MEQMLTVMDVVGRTRLKERTVRQMIADGRLPVVRLMGVRAIRVPEGAVRALMGPTPADPALEGLT